MAKKTTKKADITWLNNKKSMVTPIGIARYPYINKPSTKFDPVFKTDLVVDKSNKDFKAFILQLKKLATDAKLNPDMVDDLVKEQENDDGSVTYFIPFKTTAKPDDSGKYRSPAIFNSKNERITQTVWGGDEIRVGFKLAHWKNSLGQGLKCYLGSVQLLKKNADGPGANAPFEADDNYDPVTSVVDSGNAEGINPDTLPDNNSDEDDVL